MLRAEFIYNMNVDCVLNSLTNSILIVNTETREWLIKTKIVEYTSTGRGSLGSGRWE